MVPKIIASERLYIYSILTEGNRPIFCAYVARECDPPPQGVHPMANLGGPLGHGTHECKQIFYSP